MQRKCRNLHVFDIPLSDPVLRQAIGRLHRLGQSRVVMIYEYFNPNSFNVKQLQRNMEKALPDMVAKLNDSMFDLGLDKEAESIEIGCWVRNKDNSISRVPKELAESLDAEQLLTGILHSWS